MTEPAAAPPRRCDFTRGPLAWPMVLFALPALGASALQSVNGAINAVWTGRFLGEAAFAAVSNANLLLFLLLGAVFGISMAASIMVGQAVGAGRLEDARRTTGAAASFFFVMAALMAAGGVAATPPLMQAMAMPMEARPYAAAYLRIIFLSLPFTYLFVFAVGVVRAAGDARTPSVCLILAAVLDAALTPVLMLGLGPAPAWGIAGAAAATLIAQSLGFLVMLAALYRTGHPLALRGRDLAFLAPDRAVLRTLVVKGLPMGAQILVVSSSAVILISLVNRHGAQVTAAYGAAAQLWTYVQMPGMALAGAASVAAAQNIGAGLWPRVERTAAAAAWLCLLVTAGAAALACLLAGPTLGLFIRDPETLRIARGINLQVVWGFPLLTAAFGLFSVVRSAGAVAAPLVISVLTLWVFRAPFALAMQGVLGAQAVWLSIPLASALSLALALLYLRRGRWRSARMAA